ncbi:MAG TPA: Rrf2 family transcriptional regulator [Ignavibacteriales bacterium]|nr:Rrf2 family transcriptional regulator [Ignavibacteriales bacterium]
MIKLPKAVEYGILALKYLNDVQDFRCVSVKEIAEKANIPYDLLAKIMQKFAKKGYIESTQGSSGGYKLSKRPDEISLSEIIIVLDYKMQFTDCMESDKPLDACARFGNCPIHDPLYKIQSRIHSLLNEVKLAEII